MLFFHGLTCLIQSNVYTTMLSIASSPNNTRLLQLGTLQGSDVTGNPELD